MGIRNKLGRRPRFDLEDAAEETAHGHVLLRQRAELVLLVAVNDLGAQGLLVNAPNRLLSKGRLLPRLQAKKCLCFFEIVTIYMQKCAICMDIYTNFMFYRLTEVKLLTWI